MRGLIAALVVTALMGFLLGVIGAFLVPTGPRVGGVLLSVGVAVAVVGVPALARFTGWVSGERLLGLAPLTGFVAAGTLAQNLRHGGVILPTAPAAPDWLATWAFLLGGALAGGLALAVARRSARPRAHP